MAAYEESPNNPDQEIPQLSKQTEQKLTKILEDFVQEHSSEIDSPNIEVSLKAISQDDKDDGEMESTRGIPELSEQTRGKLAKTVEKFIEENSSEIDLSKGALDIRFSPTMRVSAVCVPPIINATDICAKRGGHLQIFF